MPSGLETCLPTISNKGELLSDVASDFAAGPEKPASYMGKVTALLYARYCAGEKPLAMVSTDNCSHNGDKLYAAGSICKGMGRESEGGCWFLKIYRFGKGFFSMEYD